MKYYKSQRHIREGIVYHGSTAFDSGEETLAFYVFYTVEALWAVPD